VGALNATASRTSSGEILGRFFVSRPALPLDHHHAAGTYRADRHQTLPLRPGQKPPRPPAWLTAGAKVKWKEAARQLAAAGVLTALDLDALAAYCEAFATWQAAVEAVAKEGATYTTESGQKKPHPSVAIMLAADKSVRDWASRLGLHVAARRQLRIEPPEAAPSGLPTRDRYPDTSRFCHGPG
jgi:P27 family predicted phage terminase small subunit